MSAAEFRKTKKMLVSLYSIFPKIKIIKMVRVININSALKFFITLVG
tara:strand:+ start:182 stop:322 length:141 start_codon:yes stop_codon:yes gene_type:complete